MKKTVQHPGVILQSIMVDKGVSQREFASLIQVAPSHLNAICNGERAIIAEFALKLEAAGMENAKYWLKKQMDFDLYSIASSSNLEAEKIRAWKSVQGLVPINYLKKHGYLTGKRDVDLESIFSHYGVSSVDELESSISNYPFNHFRKSAAFQEIKTNVIAWSFTAEAEALKPENSVKENFDLGKKDELVSKLNEVFYKNNDTINRTKELLAEYGVKFFILDRPSKTPVDGKSFMSKGVPTIVLTLKYKRLDNFAFTVMHELGHVYRHLTQKDYSSHSFFTNNTDNDILEFEANEFARNELIPKEAFDSFIQTYPVYTDAIIRRFAKENKIHPGIVRGRICFEFNNYYRRKSGIIRENELR
ncbi:HigA family addiction module antitoxin [Owenweeksia hongkongensis]|uniref:HigA family addiction module antitoxin n=1 Tax=Owenweeksia hongkongensis TaxID=253245 RepID=UPI003A8E5A64